MRLLDRRRALMAASGGESGLPSEYQQVEWIGSSGSQFINTGRYLTNDSAEIYAKFEVTDRGNYGRYICGTIANGSTSNSGLYLYYQSTSDIVVRCGGNTMVTAPLSLGTACEVDLSVSGGGQPNAIYSSRITIAGSTQSDSGTVETINYNVNVFCIFGNRTASGATILNGKIYSVYVKNDGKFFLNAIPCYRKTDGVIGMYDTVTKAFLTNAGTGTFTKGADVN